MHLQPVSQVERHKAPASRRKEGENTIKARKVGGEVAEDLFNRGLCLPSTLESQDLSLTQRPIMPKAPKDEKSKKGDHENTK